MKTRYLYILLALSLPLCGVMGYTLWSRKAVAPMPSTSAYAYPVAYAQDTLIRETGTLISFADIAEAVLPSVVHIIARKENGQSAQWYKGFFNFNPQGNSRPIVSAGSGVILDSEGYIVTNNHVVKDTDELEVILNDNRSYKASIVGTDPTTDLALLKIEATGLSSILLGNSQQARVGDWVLAVGNPFQLRSTVTAGIISAKGRNVNIISSSNRLGIESFIQTDAVVNRGNSGGALVNMRGELVGVNTAIFTQTGSYEGYSFAVPSALVRKVVEDLRTHGAVRRAILGISITDLTAQRAKSRDIPVFKGVFIDTVYPNSAAAAAGVLEGDVILSVDGVETPNVAALQEQIAIRRPDEKVVLRLIRDQQEQRVTVTLKGVEETSYTASRPEATQGLFLAPMSASDKENYNLKQGVLLLGIQNNRWRAMGLREGLAITHINKTPIQSLAQAQTLLRETEEDLIIEGIYQDGTKAYYGLPL